MDKIKIVHNYEEWLPQTMTWLHGMLSPMPHDQIENIIVVERTANLNQFPMPEIHSLDNENILNNFIRKSLRKTGIKTEMSLLNRIVKEKNPKILHSHTGVYGWYNIRMARKNNLKHVVSFYGVDINWYPVQFPIWKKRYREMFYAVDLVLCEGPFMASQIQKLGCEREKIKLHRLGINLSNIPYKQRHFKMGDTIKFLMAGTFVEKKGFLYAIKALHLLNKQYSNFSLTIIGDSSKEKRSINYKKLMLDKIQESDISDKIIMLGYLPYRDMIREAYKHDLFISPSVYATDGDCEGGAPVSIIEMAATGMPIISTTHCDIPYVLAPEYLQFLNPERDPESLLKTIEFILHNDFSYWTKKNREFIENNLDITKQSFIDGIIKNYYSLLN